MEWKEQREEAMRWFSLYNGVEGAEEEMDLIMIDFFSNQYQEQWRNALTRRMNAC